MRRVVVVAFDGCQPLDVFGPAEVFAGAAEAQQRRGARDRGYQVVIAGGSGLTVGGERGPALLAETTLARLARGRGAIDTLVVAGGAGARRAAEQPAAVRAVRQLAARARRTTSVCTGAFVLAAAGLLDGRRATTHWAYCDLLGQELSAGPGRARDPIYVEDGALWTSAGVTAGIDLALALVKRDLGARSRCCWRAGWWCSCAAPAGSGRLDAQLAAQTAERDVLREVQAHVLEHPGAALEVPEPCRPAPGMSVRNFSRVFSAEVGLSPAAFVERVRVEAARQLLETTRRAAGEVASAVGFGTPEALRRAFARRLGLSPRVPGALWRGGPGARQSAQLKERDGARRRETERKGRGEMKLVFMLFRASPRSTWWAPTRCWRGCRAPRWCSPG